MRNVVPEKKGLDRFPEVTTCFYVGIMDAVNYKKTWNNFMKMFITFRT